MFIRERLFRPDNEMLFEAKTKQTKGEWLDKSFKNKWIDYKQWEFTIENKMNMNRSWNFHFDFELMVPLNRVRMLQTC